MSRPSSHKQLPDLPNEIIYEIIKYSDNPEWSKIKKFAEIYNKYRKALPCYNAVVSKHPDLNIGTLRTAYKFICDLDIVISIVDDHDVLRMHGKDAWLNHCLTIAIEYGFLDVVKFLYTQKTFNEYYLRHFLEIAEKHGHVDIAIFLLKKGANINYGRARISRTRSLPSKDKPRRSSKPKRLSLHSTRSRSSRTSSENSENSF